MVKSTLAPCAFDARPLRVTLFPEHPQTILIYVPPGQSLWLPPLPTPFDLDRVRDALDARDVPHDTREGDRNRWRRNLQQGENDDRSVQVQQQRVEQAARHVEITLSPTATTFEKQRSEVVLMKDKVDDEIRQLKGEISHARAVAAARGVREDPDVFGAKKRRLADLQTASIALQRRLGEMRSQSRERASAPGRDQRFIEKARRHLTRDQFLAIWAEIDAEDVPGEVE